MYRIAPRMVLMVVALFGLIALMGSGEVLAVSRVKDIAHIDGLKKEMVIGYGLVVGLNGTGDGRKATFTMQSLENMLERFSITVESDEFKVANVAAVIVTGEVDPFMRIGSNIDVTVNSIGDASSLEGGTLLATPLLGLDGELYAMSQGPVSIGGFNVRGGGGNSVRNNHTTVGKVISGGVVQRAVNQSYIVNASFDLSVRDMDFNTVQSMTEAINTNFGKGTAESLDPRTVHVRIPAARKADPVGFIAELETLPVTVDVPARIVINEKTGTIVVGANVELGAAAIAHGNLTVEINTSYGVSQPASFIGTGGGETVIVPEVQTRVNENEARVFAVREALNVGELAEALNGIGVTPRDLVAIFQALKRAGALRAELVVI